MLFKIVLLAAAAAAAMYAYSHGMRVPGRARAPHVGVRNDVDDTRLVVAAQNVETWRRVNDTYEGAPTGLNNVTLVRATAISYCVQDARFHLAGPGGIVVAGPCP